MDKKFATTIWFNIVEARLLWRGKAYASYQFATLEAYSFFFNFYLAMSEQLNLNFHIMASAVPITPIRIYIGAKF